MEQIKELRNLGLILGSIFGIGFGMLLPHFHHQPWSLKFCLLGIVLISAALVHPPLLKPVNFFWQRLAAVLGWVNTRIILGVLFYVVITPIGLLRRALGFSTLLKPDPSISTYRVTSTKSPVKQLEKPF